jgi:hypothetical protein
MYNSFRLPRAKTNQKLGGFGVPAVDVDQRVLRCRTGMGVLKAEYYLPEGTILEHVLYVWI